LRRSDCVGNHGTVGQLDGADGARRCQWIVGDHNHGAPFATEVVEEIKDMKSLSWTNGWLVLHDETIGEAAMKFNRHNVTQIEIEQPAIAARAIQGLFRYPLDSPAEFARAIAAISSSACVRSGYAAPMLRRVTSKSPRMAKMPGASSGNASSRPSWIVITAAGPSSAWYLPA
jgi:hypothetical protein